MLADSWPTAADNLADIPRAVASADPGGRFGAGGVGHGFTPAGEGATAPCRPAGGAGLDLPVQDPLDGHGTPVPAARGRDAAAVQPVSDLAERRAARLHRQDEGEQVGRPLGRLGRLRGVALGAAVELAAQVGRIAQLDAARLGGIQSASCSGRYIMGLRNTVEPSLG